MNFRVACLLLGVEIALAEIYNYGAGNSATGNNQPVVPPPNTGSWTPWSDLGNLFTTGGVPGQGGSWTYQPSSWTAGPTFDPFGTNQAWSPTTQAWTTAPYGFPTTQWTAWSAATSATQGATGAALASFTRYEGNCQGNYLGAVTQLTLEACASGCLAIPACAGFSYNTRSTYPQCIMKNAVCSSPDTSATFTFFARAGYPASVTNTGYYPYQTYPQYVPVAAVPPAYSAPAAAPAPAPPAYAPYVGSYPQHYHGLPWRQYGAPQWKAANLRQFKKLGVHYYELPGNCSGPIMRGPYNVMIDRCADDCSTQKACTGFSFDNKTDSCIMHTGICLTVQKSNQWSYYARGGHVPIETKMSSESDNALESKPQLIDYVAISKPAKTTTTTTTTTTSAPPRNTGFPYNYNPMDLLNRFEQMNGNCPGNALSEQMTATLDECARMCLNTYNCAGFTFNIRVNRPEDFQCMLKTQGCSDPSENSPYRFFRRRAVSTFRFRQRR